MPGVFAVRDSIIGVQGALGGARRGWPLDVLTFTQSISGTNIVTNGDMEAGDPPTGWTPGGATLDGVADERTGGSGAQSLSIVGSGGDLTPQASRSVTFTANRWYMLRAWLKLVTAWRMYSRVVVGARSWTNPASPYYEDTAGWALCERSIRTTGTSHTLLVDSANTLEADEARADDVGLFLVTLNAQQTLPNANAEIVVDLDLPVSGTYIGQFIEVYYRISGTLESELNCWCARLRRNQMNINWTIELVSISSGVETIRASLDDIGTPTALKVMCYGSEHQVYAYIDGEWSALHSVVDVSHNDTQTGVNMIYSEAMTPLRLRARASNPFDFGLSGSGLAFLAGDSKTDETGYGEWPPMFVHAAERISGQDWSYYNVAVSGATLAMGLLALPGNLAALSDTPAPDVALVNFGANDVKIMAGNESNWKSQFRSYVEAIHAKWATTPIYFMRAWRPDYTSECDTLAGWLADVVAEYAYVHLGPDERVFIKSNDDGHGQLRLPYPNSHPNGYGSILTARAWRDLLW